MSLVLIFFLLAAICFILAAIPTPRFNALALGLLFLTIALAIQFGVVGR